MNSSRSFRRPAVLSPEQTEGLVGEEDVATKLEVSYITAKILLKAAHTEEILDAETSTMAKGIIRILSTEGPDLVAQMWAEAPASSLPGAMWRLYLVYEWLKRETHEVNVLVSDWSAENKDKIRVLEQRLSCLFTATASIDLAEVLETSAWLLESCAHEMQLKGNLDIWIKERTHILAFDETRRMRAFAATAEELRKAKTSLRHHQNKSI